jgi:RHS repeat-associated protein
MHPSKNRIVSDFFVVQNLSGSYRYSFQNQENDKEIKGSGNSIDFGARIYDSRVGRWLSCDPLFGNQPSWSPYKAMYDNPMIYQDPDGMDEIIRIRVVDYKSNTTTVIETTIPYLVMTDGRYRQEGALPAYYGYYNYVSNYTLYLHKEGPPTGTSDGVQILTNELQMQDLILGPFQIEPKYGDQSLVIPEFSFEGSGGYQPSGFRLVSKEGGASPTKQKSGHVAQRNGSFRFTCPHGNIWTWGTIKHL